jgi:hypothetical protein
MLLLVRWGLSVKLPPSQIRSLSNVLDYIYEDRAPAAICTNHPETIPMRRTRGMPRLPETAIDISVVRGKGLARLRRTSYVRRPT